MAPRLAPLAWLLPAARRRGWLQESRSAAAGRGLPRGQRARRRPAAAEDVPVRLRLVRGPAVRERGHLHGAAGAALAPSGCGAHSRGGPRRRRPGAHLRPGRRSARPQRPGRQAEDARGFRRKVAGGAPERSGEGGAAPELGRPQAGGRCGGSREAAVGQLPPLGALQRAGRRRAGGRHPRARALPAELRPLGRRRPLHGGRRAAREGLRGPLRGGRAEGRAPARPPEGGGGGEGPPRHPELLQHGAVPAPAGPAGVPRGRPSRERHDCRGRRVARGGPRGAECHGRGAVGHHPAFRRVLLHVRLRHVRRRRLAAARGLEEAPAPGAVLLAGLALRMPRPCLPPLPPPACSPSSRRGFHLELGSNSSSFAQGRIDVHSQALIRGL
ncbi:unnamed protein product [Prorocentrum cordatum]|uniref:Uncharacterized protein n=1 Tax=Prorocentrum cordatum TaxID=2364126 RepID=A0ABN9SUW9_9DINO|nr:unnamed protein product [Polarella glacialis]